MPFEHEEHLKDLLKGQIALNNVLNLDKHDEVIDDEVSNDRKEIPA